MPSVFIVQGKNVFFLLVFLVFCFNLNSQSITGQLVDATTELGISDAFVFISNSTIGTTTDADGNFTLEVNSIGGQEIYFSHLNYENESIFLSHRKRFPLRIALQPTESNLTEIVVSTAKSAKRKTWIAQFESALLGNSRNRRKTHWLNPEVVLFSEENGVLTADAYGPLEIRNDALGYEIDFFLSDFEAREDEVRYSGSAFFKEVLPAKRRHRKKVQSNRKRTYASSSTAFFKSLTSGKFNDKKFTLGWVDLDSMMSVDTFIPLTASEFQWSRNERYDTLFCPHSLAIVDRRNQAKWLTRSYLDNRKSLFTSVIGSLDGFFVIDKNGNLINHDKVEEIGYWTNYRLSDLLPLDHAWTDVDPIIYEQSDKISQLISRLENMSVEKTFIQFDRPYYALGDTIRFRTFLLDGMKHIPQVSSHVVYVDVFDPSDQYIKTLKYNRRDLSGYFAVRKGMPGGRYRFRAYTNFMRNWDSKYFFDKDVLVVDHLSQLQQKPLELAADFQMDGRKREKITFVPEGGQLIQGIKNQIVFHIDPGRHENHTEGNLIDESGQIVQSLQIFDEGLGKVSFTPDSTHQYYLNFANGQNYLLPESKPNGMLLHVSSLSEENIYTTIRSLDPDEHAFLIGHVRGEPFLVWDEIDFNLPIAINRNEVPRGIINLTLFDGDGQPISERLLFNEVGLDPNHVSISTDSTHYGRRSKVSLSIEVHDSSLLNADLSLAVSDLDLMGDKIDQSLERYLLFNSDLPNAISLEHLNLSKFQRRFLYDLWLMTQKPSRYHSHLIENRNLEIEHKAQQGLSLSGKVLFEKPRDTFPIDVWLAALRQDFFMIPASTDSLGYVRFENLDFTDTTSFVLRAGSELRLRNDNKRSKVVSAAVNFEIDSLEIPPLTPRRNWEGHESQYEAPEAFISHMRNKHVADSIFNNLRTFDLPEVLVEGRRAPDSRLFDTYDVSKTDWIHGKTNGYNMLSRLRPGLNFSRDIATGDLYKSTYDFTGQPVKVPVTVIIDGFQAHSHRLLALTADMIDFISVTESGEGVVVAVQLKSGDRRNRGGSKRSRLKQFRQVGYAPTSTFTGPTYASGQRLDAEPDLRATLHWEPNVRTGVDGKIDIAFWTADVASSYLVVLQGVLEDGTPVYEQRTFQVQ